MSCKVLKLITGEELIGELVSDEGGVYVLESPLAIGINHQEQRLVFMPYMPYTTAEDKVEILSHSLAMLPLTPIDSIASDYRNATSRIELPSRSLIRPAR